MYKRPAHILFVSYAETPTELVCELLRQALKDYLQGRCIELDQNAVAAEAMVEEISWADLVIGLDEMACQCLRESVLSLPLQCWSLPKGEQECLAFVRDKLASMVAGMRMMQRLDG